MYTPENVIFSVPLPSKYPNMMLQQLVMNVTTYSSPTIKMDPELLHSKQISVLGCFIRFIILIIECYVN